MSREIKIGKHKLKVRNPVASSLSDPRFKPKVIKDKRKYNRKKKHEVDLTE
jgi:hypothetical protein